jgi:prolyl-tRNA synthetase
MEKISQGPNPEKMQKEESLYPEMLIRAEVFDYAPSKGCIVLKPYGMSMWKSIQNELGNLLQDKAEANDAYFPALIPQKLIEKEKAHIKGFSPELMQLSIGEKKTGLVLRPTSETIIYDLFSDWIKSYRDLPLKINQWCSVYRAELRTYPFLRTREFLWQELHAAHNNGKEASDYVQKILNLYLQFIENHLAITAVTGLKTEKEKFPGAKYTTTLEALPKEKALQVGTSHNLGTGFSEAFGVKFLDKDNLLKSPYLTSHGVSWRILGAMFLSHNDERGLILPPKIAPHQVVIIPSFSGEEVEEVMKKTNELNEILVKSGIRVKVDREQDKTLGFKYNYWDGKGVPLRIVIGDREVKNKIYEVARRDKNMRDPDQKIKIPFGKDINKTIAKTLDEIQNNLLAESRKHIQENIRQVDDRKELEELIKTKGGFNAVFLCNQRKCEDELKKIKASVRCIPFNGQQEEGKCIFCGKPSSYGKRVLVAKAY